MREGQFRSTKIQEYDKDYSLISIETPVRSNAFKIDDELKIELIEKSF